MTRTVPQQLRAVVLALIGVLALTTVAYLFFSSAGFSPRKLPDKGYHNRLADGFLHGQLHILEAPSAALLAQKDPYDFQTSRHLWRIWDASLYEGKYYLYWGPLPAVLAAGAKLVAGATVFVGDRSLALVFVLGRLFVGTAILALVLRSMFPALSLWQLLPAVLLWGLANPTPYLLGRPGVYEVAIEAGQFFLLLGLLTGLVAVRGCSTRARELRLLAATGSSWALAIGCRVSLLFAVAALGLLTVLAASSAKPRAWREVAVRAIVLGAPLAGMLFALGLYNNARFGSFFDFGTDYMLTRHHFSPQASFVLPNLHSYLFRRFTVSCEFPFLAAPFFAHTLTPAWVVTPGSGWVPQEPVVGLFVAIPALPFAAVALGAALKRARRDPAKVTDGTRDVVCSWLVASCAVIWLFAAVPTLGVWTSTMRYLSDVTPSALILAITGFWVLLATAQKRGTRSVAAALNVLGAILVVYTVTVGLALGLQGGYYRAIKAHNPSLHEKLVQAFSLCEGSTDRKPPAKAKAR